MTLYRCHLISFTGFAAGAVYGFELGGDEVSAVPQIIHEMELFLTSQTHSTPAPESDSRLGSIRSMGW